MSFDVTTLNGQISTLLNDTDLSLDDLGLVPSVMGEYVYSGGSFWGTVCYFVHRLAKSGTHVPFPLKESILNVYRIFQEAMKEMKSIQKENEFMRKNCVGLRSWQPLRKRQVEIGDGMLALFDIFIPHHLFDRMHRLNAIFQRVISMPLAQEEEIEELSNFQSGFSVNIVEAALGELFPYGLLSDISQKKSWHEQQEKLHKWLEDLEENTSYISSATLCEALRFAANNDQECLYTLERTLMEEGCSLLLRKSPYYLKWVESLLPGTNLGSVRLGKPYFITPFSVRGFSLFEREGFPGQMVVIGATKDLAGMWASLAQESSQFLETVKVFEIDRRGRYAVVEKPAQLLQEIVWESRFAQVSEKDIPLLDSIAQFIHSLAHSETMPKILDAKMLFFTAEKKLKALFPFVNKQDFDYNGLEKFVLDLSKNNYLIFWYLMNHSGLIDHPVCQFYLNFIEKRLKRDEQELSIDNEMMLCRITAPNVKQKALEELQQLKELRVRTLQKFSRLLVRNSEDERKLLHTKITRFLIDMGKETGGAATLWPESLVEESCAFHLQGHIVQEESIAQVAFLPVTCSLR